MKLTANMRAGETKNAVKQMRRAGKIPAIFYSPNQTGSNIEIDATQFETVLRNIKPGRLSTTVFEIDYDGKKSKALIKEIQYERTTYKVIHLDFIELSDKVPVTVKVPIEFSGIAECIGIKLGGFLRPIIRFVKVECLPKDIPQEFEVDVREMKIKQAKRLSDIAMPKGIRTLASTDEVVVVIAKR